LYGHHLAWEIVEKDLKIESVKNADHAYGEKVVPSAKVSPLTERFWRYHSAFLRNGEHYSVTPEGTVPASQTMIVKLVGDKEG
jgi:hypothetical protein